MSEFDSPNYAEYTYDKKNVGKTKAKRTIFIIFYIIFTIGLFAAICAAHFLPLIAIEPIVVWMVVFFTWKLVSYDCYFTFDGGILELGKVKVSKRGRKKTPRHKIHVKDAHLICPYIGNESALNGAKKIDDLSESEFSEHRIIIIYDDSGVKTAVVFEGTKKIAKLLSSFCPNARDLKDKEFHG